MSRSIGPNLSQRAARKKIQRMTKLIHAAIQRNLSKKKNLLRTIDRARQCTDAVKRLPTSKCEKTNLSTHWLKNLKRRLLRSTVALLIQSLTLIFNVKFAGTIARPKRIPCWIHANVMVLCASSIMSVSSTGSSKRWPRKRRRISFLTHGSNSNVRYAKNLIRMFFDQMAYHID